MSYASSHPYLRGLGVTFADAVKAGAPATPANTVPGLPPSIAWAPPNMPPFDAAQYQPARFVEEQVTRWARSEMQQSIEHGRDQLAQALRVSLPKMPTMSRFEVEQWTAAYVGAHGVPKDLEGGAQMVTALAHAQAERAGVAPEWIAAADALMHPPTSVEEGFALVAEVGKGYFMRYGVPLLQNELMSLSSNLAMVGQAIPIQFAEAGFDALKDGKLTGEEIAGIAVQATAYACGLLLQGIGIPAPLGALMCGVIASGLTKVADDIIHSEDADTRARKKAIAELEKQRSKLMSQCAESAQEVWNKTQEYWDQVLAPIQSLMDQPAVRQRLIAAGGVRYYGRNSVELSAGVTLPNAWPKDRWQDPSLAQQAADAETAAKAAEVAAARNKGGPQESWYSMNAATLRARANTLAIKAADNAKKPLYSYGFDCVWWDGDLVFDYDASKARMRQLLPATTKPYPDGCLYYTRMRPKRSGPQTLDPATWQASAYWPDPTSIWERCAVALPPGGYSYDPATFHASGEDEAHCAPTLKNAAEWRYNFKAFQDTREMVVRITPYSDHTSPVRVQALTVMPGAMVNGQPNAQAALMFWGAIRPATVWSAYTANANDSDAVQWRAFAYIDPSAIEVYKQAGKLHAELNISQDYCNVGEWYATVQTAAAASALVQQDVIRTVAWQVGAEEAQRQAAAAKLAADRAAAGKSAASAKTAWQAAAAQSIAQQAARAQLQAKALGMARASSGAYNTALKARLRFQSEQLSQAVQRALLWTGGLALGGYLIWRVAQAHRGR